MWKGGDGYGVGGVGNGEGALGGKCHVWVFKVVDCCVLSGCD